MATSITYNTLLARLQSYSERGSTADTVVNAELPYLINQAERRIARELKIQGVQNVAMGSLTSGSESITKPTDWRETISFIMDVGGSTVNRYNLFERSYEFIRFYDRTGANSTPKFYTEYNYTTWIVAPRPSVNMNYSVLYWGLPPLLDSGNQTNWLTDYAQELIVYGSLLELAIFLKDKELRDTYNEQYARAVAALTEEDRRKLIDRSSERYEG